MGTEEIVLGGEKIRTLKELLRPGLRAVFVGLNPSTVSAEKGHYYQGQLGRRFWDRLQEHAIVPPLTRGNEDEEAFRYGFGFADLVRRPTPSAKGLSQAELVSAVPDLAARLSAMGDRPTIVFVYSTARKIAGSELEAMGYRVLVMPAPYAKRADVDNGMDQLGRVIVRGSNLSSPEKAEKRDDLKVSGGPVEAPLIAPPVTLDLVIFPNVDMFGADPALISEYPPMFLSI